MVNVGINPGRALSGKSAKLVRLLKEQLGIRQ